MKTSLKQQHHFLVFNLLIFILFFMSCRQKEYYNKEVSIIPKVQKIEIKESFYSLTSNTVFGVQNKEQYKIAKYLADKINQSKGWNTTVAIDSLNKSDIQFTTDNQIQKEGYQINISEKRIQIKASTNAGFFYGMQSLRQLLPPEIESVNAFKGSDIKLPQLEILDAPRFAWRGMMLDVSRHFYTTEEVKDLIDLMSCLKLNTFHWHLVDDQGWRIEIKKYPKLTKVGAWRVDKETLHWNKRPTPLNSEKPTYGGFYTQEQIKEVVAYAQSKFITIVPEIELPAHVMSAIAAYPFLSCDEKPIMVPSGGVWPITKIYCAGKESTYTFIEDVLDEVINLFPSKYIHIGGDEATKTNWKICKHCQQRIKKENLKSVEELQSYMVKRIAKYMESKNKTMIGWDEILEGGLADGAVVMSWRGAKGGMEAAELNHDVIMSPNTYVYFDYYQAPKETEPLAIGGYLPLRKVYEFNPIPEGLPKEYQQYILGGQANVWTEYMPNYKHLQYMVFPRLLALSESVWTDNPKKNWNDFSKRVEIMMDRFDFMGVNYSKSAYKLRSDISYDPESKHLELRLFNEFEDTEIRYTTDSTLPNKTSKEYKDPITITENTIVKSQVFNNKEKIGNTITDSIIMVKNKAFGKKVIYKNKYTEKYNSGGGFGLVDGLRGSTAFDDWRWQGWFDEGVEFTIDFGEEIELNKIAFGLLVDRQNQILLPKNIKVFVSNDNKDFKQIAEFNSLETLNNEVAIRHFSKEINTIKSHYIKVVIENSSNSRTAEKGWTFIDEFVVQ
ncbi:family 20 glycosylhydrolase [Flavivirga sp. 57AJ16]|uniref:glycoside hydrolase family 20 protein n=1 Tax=Flavivirga sp. 57AJ16 TaxID=3025307 RepID=UPI002366397A|nr:family 20 glycosylhydrolase [Flavivirga sp. 57AJ16]MDD7885080.1 family 20 glycosylhydrolase [Flavivirga sp. 57AJ16]